MPVDREAMKRAISQAIEREGPGAVSEQIVKRATAIYLTEHKDDQFYALTYYVNRARMRLNELKSAAREIVDANRAPGA